MNKRHKTYQKDGAQTLLSTAIITDAVIACFCAALYCATPWLEHQITWISGGVWEYIEEISLVSVVGALTAIVGLSVLLIVHTVFRRLQKKKR